MEGRALSGVVSDVISLAGSPRGDLSDLADLIGRDAMLTARVLQAANSAAFAGARKMVTTLSDAVRQIGATNVRNTAMTLGVFEAMPTAEGGDVNPIRAWQHSFAVATICRTLAEAADKGIDPGVSYLAGLCHDLGMVLFRTEFASEYAAVMQRKAQSSRPLPQIERHMLGMTQADLSQLILKKLGLPAAICAPIGEFHAQASRPDRPALQPLARLLRVANLYADGVLLAESPASEISPITKLECREGIGTDDMPPIDGAVMRGQIFAMTAMLARLPPGQTAPLMRPLIEPAGKRILLVREPAFSTLDPVAAALESLGEFRVVSEFGNMADAGECDAIIVESLHRSPLPMNLTAPILRLSKAHEESSQREGAPAGGGVIEAGPAISLQHLAGFLTQIKVAQSAAA
jgi:HD-like signal output (HDOD) protein